MNNHGKSAGIIATVIIAAIITAYWVGVFLLTFVIGERWFILLAGMICLPLTAALIVTAVRRIREIKEEDKDDYRKY